MSFLPENYKVPSESPYMKFKEGINKFRILSAPILGFEVWVDDGDKRKPVRAETLLELQKKTPLTEYKHFWAMPVWNYNDNKVQILEITQKGIQMSLTALVTDEDWGSPLNYDIVVTKTGQKLDTEYSVQPKPAKTLDEEIKNKFESIYVNVAALYTGDDPFKKRSEQPTENVDPKDIPF